MVSKTPDSSNPTAVEVIDGFAENDLAEITSFADVLNKADGPIENISDVLGNGFSVLDDKMRLIGAELVIVKYGEHKSDKNDGTFATIHVVTRDGGKWIVNDGSTGIRDQLRELKDKAGTVCPLYVPKGLRVSEYDYKDDKGNTSKARTYYLNTSK